MSTRRAEITYDYDSGVLVSHALRCAECPHHPRACLTWYAWTGTGADMCPRFEGSHPVGGILLDITCSESENIKS